MSIDAMKQALEALKECSRVPHIRGLQPTIAALRLAIEQAERQEPVAWQATADKCQIQTVPAKGGLLPTAPPQRQPLTEEEMLEILVGIDAETKRLPPGMKAFARAIERAHGIGGGE